MCWLSVTRYALASVWIGQEGSIYGTVNQLKNTYVLMLDSLNRYVIIWKHVLNLPWCMCNMLINKEYHRLTNILRNVIHMTFGSDCHVVQCIQIWEIAINVVWNMKPKWSYGHDYAWSERISSLQFILLSDIHFSWRHSGCVQIMSVMSCV